MKVTDINIHIILLLEAKHGKKKSFGTDRYTS